MDMTIVYIIVLCILALIVAVPIIRIIRRARRRRYIQNQIYVGNLPYRVNEYDLKKYFSKFGEVKDARIVKQSKTGRSKGFAFVTFMGAKQAKKALIANGKSLRGRTMVVRIAKPPKTA